MPIRIGVFQYTDEAFAKSYSHLARITEKYEPTGARYFQDVRHPLNILITAEFQLICSPVHFSGLHRLLRLLGHCPSGGAVLHLNNSVDVSRTIWVPLLIAGDVAVRIAAKL